jgi:hypothetical protein
LVAADAFERAVACAGTAAKGDVVPEEEVAFGPVCAAVELWAAFEAMPLIELWARMIVRWAAREVDEVKVDRLGLREVAKKVSGAGCQTPHARTVLKQD